jgi:site-specific DNA-methyltransferase (adenine-specific)
MSVHRGDCVAWLRTQPAGGAQALITDPPYSSGGQFRSDRSASTGAKYTSGDSKSGARHLQDFHGDNRDQRSFLSWSHLWLSAAYEALDDGAFVALFTDWRQLPTMSDALQAGGFIWRGVAVWHKPNARPQRGRPSNACEFVVWGSKGPMPMRGATHPGLWAASPPRSNVRAHQTEKPLSILRALARVVPSGGVVLDPFAGSGSLGEACALEGVAYRGCELSEHYARTAQQRLEAALSQQELFK